MLEKTIWSKGKDQFENNTFDSREWSAPIMVSPNEIEERIMLINTISLAQDMNSLISFKNAVGEEKINGLGYPYQMPKE